MLKVNEFVRSDSYSIVMVTRLCVESPVADPGFY